MLLLHVSHLMKIESLNDKVCIHVGMWLIEPEGHFSQNIIMMYLWRPNVDNTYVYFSYNVMY